MASILGDGTGPGGPGSSRCLLLLQRSLAIQLTRGPPPHSANGINVSQSPKEHPADEMWMYDKGYNLFQVSRVYLPSFHLYSFIYIVDIVLSRQHASLSFSFNFRRYSRLIYFRALFVCPERSLAPEKFRGNERRNGKRKPETSVNVESLHSSRLRLLFLPLVSAHRVLYRKADVDCPHRYATMRQCELRAISQK